MTNCLVPVEPTEAMIEAMDQAIFTHGNVHDSYRAMLAAAPASPLPGGGDEALIAELKEARGLLERALTVIDPWDVGSETTIISEARAFLARNGKGEG